MVMKDGESWFVAKDMCEILGYKNPSKAISDHVDDDEKLNNETLSSLGQRGWWLINEHRLYALIMKSRKPEAEAFQDWVTEEVIPSIRKTGSYSMTHAKATRKPCLRSLLLKKKKNALLLSVMKPFEQVAHLPNKGTHHEIQPRHFLFLLRHSLYYQQCAG